ncbi:hypothetical protein CERSUDRAFT_64629 [Gelatoporia subvermispora B]|uniref:DUF6533 domain-containing protein n=1 Tax=Ceriporiopsis subvermispora (strain B) TaxID=914234 RepID=M2QMW4_CERS8|nr:hypothetical protein CERSUDRAFT_64629 [Gelatoporia subvermispora B]
MSTYLRLAVLYYDYFTTFSMEVERFWKQSPFSCISILFVINRYLSLIGPIPVTIEYFGNIAEILQSFHQYYAVFTQAVVAALLLLRTYALYNRDARILCLMLATCAAGIVASIWVLLVDKTFTEDSKVALNWPGYLVGAWSSMLAFDTLVFVLTLVRAIQVEGLWKGTLFRIMLRDGA